MPNLIDLTGKRFGRLTVIEYLGKGRWLCACECGNRKAVSGPHLRSGATKSCGCLHSDQLKRSLTKHGGSKTRLYRIWLGMRKRCSNENCRAYERYGARGIKVCEEWSESFEAFRAWSLANGYADDLSIDRIDNDCGYSPDNCRWATAMTQTHNRRKCKRPFQCRPIEKIDESGSVIASYPSITDAVRCLGKNNVGTLGAALANPRRTAYGFHWRYRNDSVGEVVR